MRGWRGTNSRCSGRLTGRRLGRSLRAAGLPRPPGERFDLQTTYLVRTERPSAAQEVIRTLTFMKSLSSDSDHEDEGRTREGIESSGGDAGVCLQVRDLAVDDLLVALAHSYESKSLGPGRTFDRPAPFAKEGVVAQIQALGTHTACLNKDTKRS
jgi:hypothetical protein